MATVTQIHPRGIALGVLVGVIVAFAGIGLLNLIHLISNLAFHGDFSFEHRDPGFATFGWPVLFVPAAGGLLIGWIARFGSPEIRGHGIPEAMQGVMMRRSKIPLKVAVLKPLSTALSIGTGGPFGAEGPIIATGGGIGSLAGQWLPHSDAERKILLAAGAAAGMTAVFGTPLAGVLLAVELLLFEFRGRSLLPVAMAAGAAMAVRGLLDEPFPMLPMPALDAPGPVAAIGAAVIGAVSGLVAVGMTRALHGIESLYEKLPFHWMWWPAIGGLLVGIIGWIAPRTLGTGYGNLRDLLEGNPAVSALACLALFKFLSWSLYLGSGTAGGTLAPVMTVGGAAGALAVKGLVTIPLFAAFPPGLAALVGMAAVFAGMSRAFLASVAFAFEATHSTSAFGPLLLGCAVAVLVSRRMMKESVMTEKMARDGIRVPVDYEPDALATVDVAFAMTSRPATLPRSMTVGELAERIAGPDEPWCRARLFPIVENGLLRGVITRTDVLAAVRGDPARPVLEAGTCDSFLAYPDQSLAEAADTMLLHGVGRLPVVERGSRPVLVGLVTRREILQARQRRLAEERRP